MPKFALEISFHIFEMSNFPTSATSEPSAGTVSEPVCIDLDAVLRSKLGAKARWVPRFVVDWLKRTVHQDELNDILRRHAGLYGADFCRAILDEFDVGLKVRQPLGAPDRENSRVIIVCNHPLGGLDGMALIHYFTNYYGTEVRFVVNDILMAVEPLRNVFIPVNKHGSQSRASLRALDVEMSGDRPIVIFPAGLVSRKGKGGAIRDLKWNKMFVTKALQYRRNVLPVHFSGHNSPFFYNLALWRKRLLVPFNIEMLYLPDEVIRSRGKQFTLTVGSIIDYRNMAGASPADVADRIKELVYTLAL